MPNPGNRTGSDTQGAFGDQDKQETQGQGETKYDKASRIEPEMPDKKDSGESQASKDPARRNEGR